MAEKIKLTKDRVSKLLAKHQEASDKPQVDIYDTELKGFLVRLGKTKAVYCVAKRCNGRMVRVVIGDHGVFLPDHTDPKLNARKRAAILIAEMESGCNPNEAKKSRREQGLTLSEALETYFLDNPKLRPNTIKIYRGLLHNHAADWLKKPLKSITHDMVMKRHTDLTRRSFPETANKFVRTIRAICYANKPLVPENPACMPRKKWNPSERRTGLIKAHQLPAWFIGVMDHCNQDIADYFMLLLLTGMRRGEGLALRWEDVDLESRQITARDTKNGKDHTMPLSRYLCEMLERRRGIKINDFVFPSVMSESGHLEEPKLAARRVSEKSGVKFTCHDLRRTFISVAQYLGIAPILIKKLVNHSTGDVTDGYSFEIEASGPHQKMQEITDTIFTFITRPAAFVTAIVLMQREAERKGAKVIDLGERRKVHVSN